MRSTKNDSEIGQVLRARRLQLGLKLPQLALRCGLTWRYIEQLEQGKKSAARDDLIALAKALNTTPRKLLAKEGAVTESTRRVDALTYTLAQTIKSERQNSGLSLKELSDAAGMTYPELCRMETGHRDISIRKLAVVAKALSRTPVELILLAQERLSQKTRSGHQG